MKKYPLEKVLISQRIHDSWQGTLNSNINKLLVKYPDLNIEEIPDESFRVLKTGIGQVFITVRETTISLNVPQDEFSIKK